MLSLKLPLDSAMPVWVYIQEKWKPTSAESLCPDVNSSPGVEPLSQMLCLLLTRVRISAHPKPQRPSRQLSEHYFLPSCPNSSPSGAPKFPSLSPSLREAVWPRLGSSFLCCDLETELRQETVILGLTPFPSVRDHGPCCPPPRVRHH